MNTLSNDNDECDIEGVKGQFGESLKGEQPFPPLFYKDWKGPLTKVTDDSSTNTNQDSL